MWKTENMLKQNIILAFPTISGWINNLKTINISSIDDIFHTHN